MSRQDTVYQVRITLENSEPPIWRRVQVKGDTSLADLHRIIQIAMGWEDYHLYEFTVGKVVYMPSSPGDDFFMFDEKPQSVSRNTLESVTDGRRIKFQYVYDMGDDWTHAVKVEKTLAPEEGIAYPRCLAGERACPPEDCGGVWGYEELLEILSEPEHEAYGETLEWLGEGFDPEAFDLDAVNKELARRFKRRSAKKG